MNTKAQGTNDLPGDPCDIDAYGIGLTLERASDSFTRNLKNYSVNPIGYNCGSRSFFVAYEDDTVNWTFGAKNSPNGSVHVILGESHPVNGFLDYPIINDLGIIQGGITRQLPINGPGLYSVYFPDYWQAEFYVVVIPRVRKVWIEAPDICDADNFICDYNFKIRTFPSIDSIMWYSGAIEKVECTACLGGAEVGRLSLNMNHSSDFGPTRLDYNDLSGPSIVWDSRFYQPQEPNLENYHIDHQDIVNALSVSGGNDFYHIEVSFWDGVKTWNVSKPISISFQNHPPGSGYVSWGNVGEVNGIYIENNTTWTPSDNPRSVLTKEAEPVLRIPSNLYIYPDASLTIKDMEIQFGEGNRVEVKTESGKNGGRLILDNSKVTAFRACGENIYWDGINVWGDVNRSQEPVTISPFGPCAQGFLEMKNNSELSYASFGAVHLWDAFNQDVSKSGGIVQAKNSKFINNEHAVDFQKYRNFDPVNPSVELPNRSYFTNCLFEVTEQFPNTWNGFISGWATRGVGVYGCKFYNNIPGFQGHGYGIYGADFGVTVNESGLLGGSQTSEFKNLQIGIFNEYIGGSPASATVKNSVFLNNDIAIYSNGQVASAYLSNDFVIPEKLIASPILDSLVLPSYNGNMGIYLLTGDAYEVRGNSFTEASQFGTIGTLAWNTGMGEHDINRNSFDGLHIANLSNFRNTNSDQFDPKGLQYTCNQMNGNVYDIAARGSSAISSGIRPRQGKTNLPAANTFSIGDAGHQYEFYLPLNEVNGITYYYNNSAQPNEIPQNYTSNTNPFQGINNNACIPLDSDYLWEISTNPPLFITGKLKYYLSDTASHYTADSLYHYLDLRHTPMADVVMTDLLLGKNEPILANALYDEIENKYNLEGEDSLEFSHFGKQLMDVRMALINEGKNDRQLSPSQVQILENVADSAVSWAKTRAQAWLRLYDGRNIWNTVLVPEDQGDSIQFRRLKQNPYDFIALYPNPSADKVTVEFYSSQSETLNIEFRDIAGKIIYKNLEIPSGVEIDVRSWAPGVYVYYVREKESVLKVGKFVKY